MVKNILNSTKFQMSAYNAGQLGIAEAEVAFAGRSNVGKSSLLNALCRQHQLAKVSNTPGKTRTINVFPVKHGRWIVDLPGYGYATVSEEERRRWEKMITGYVSGRASLKAVFVLVDAYTGIKELDIQMLEWLKSLNMPFYVIANKTDRIPKTKLDGRLQQAASGLKLKPEELIPVSAKTGTGMGRLRALVTGLLGV